MYFCSFEEVWEVSSVNTRVALLDPSHLISMVLGSVPISNPPAHPVPQMESWNGWVGAAGAWHPWDRGRHGYRQPLRPTTSPDPSLVLQSLLRLLLMAQERLCGSPLKASELWRTSLGRQISRNPGETLCALLSTGPEPTKVSRRANIGCVLEPVWVSS